MNTLPKFTLDRPPTPEEIKRARLHIGDTMEEAAARIHREKGSWSRYEGGEREMDQAAWELYLIKAREAWRERRSSKRVGT